MPFGALAGIETLYRRPGILAQVLPDATKKASKGVE
jgi:hypothetical protein